MLDLPLSFTTVPIVEGQPRPYEDEVVNDGLIRYRYRGTDPQHRDNVGLRTCMERQIPSAGHSSVSKVLRHLPTEHEELLDAAHILPDGHPRGEPWVCNGLALCKLHHAAFDNNILGVRPDLIVEVRKDVLEEIDGPMLQHGLKECHEKRLLVLPGARNLKPRPDFLEERYELFRSGR